MTKIIFFKKFNVGKFILFLLLLFLFFLNYRYNFFNLTNASWFSNFQKSSESLVIGRLTQSYNHGIWSYSGALDKINNFSDIYTKYENFIGGENNKFIPYLSQIGGQGIFFSYVDKFLYSIVLLHPQQRLDLIYSFAVILLALLFIALSRVYALEFGLLSSFAFLMCLFCSPWVTIMARNLYWFPVVLYLPFFISSLFLHFESYYNKKNLLLFGSLIFLAVFIKSSAGYEYISSVLLSSIVPVVYYSIKDKWPWHKTLYYMIFIGGLGLLSFLLVNVIHIYQDSVISNISWKDSLYQRISHAGSRMYAKPGTLGIPSWEGATTATTMSVIARYFSIELYNFNDIIGLKYFNSVNADVIIALLVIFTALSLISEQYSKNITRNRRKILALVATCWFSLLSPISWFTLAKVHSWAHTHINPFLWFLPFTPLVATLIGFVVSCFYKDLKNFNPKVAFKFIVSICVFSFAVFVGDFIQERNGFIKIYNDIATKKEWAFNTPVGFDVVKTRDNNVVLYSKNCRKIELGTRFFLHLYPSAGAEGKGKEFINKDFNWPNNSISSGVYSVITGKCIFSISIPEGVLAKVVIGQYLPSGPRVWVKTYHVN
ncbi:hypothetical protein [Mangrovibacter plantisponsor]|uniref:Glycosyltransferase RgtA/B/C/D-like domain-containing protein n=1 Tax=Mangrovibacter plantisponsor TaxID=451513 RepID=A0A317Q737_9ENTR|nr:hypothetical protein [Mangrovibacter plantisponsor]PWW11560.1 hypothetical protein DES37_102166 [Mangrovibacter plantisponsor]